MVREVKVTDNFVVKVQLLPEKTLDFRIIQKKPGMRIYEVSEGIICALGVR